jgi:hypothetical protein
MKVRFLPGLNEYRGWLMYHALQQLMPANKQAHHVRKIPEDLSKVIIGLATF